MATVLIIEDDPTVRASVQDCLEDSGFETLSIASGQAGVQTAQAVLPDLILCDVQMPGMSGYEVLLTLRQVPETAAIPFIFLTAKDSQSDFRYGMDLGADDYLIKPFQPQDLLRAVGSRLNKQAVVQSQGQQQMDQLRQSIALSLPHEFRTPITSLLTAVELLREVADQPEDVIELADSIQGSTQRLYKLVQNFLLYADLEIRDRSADTAKHRLAETTLDPLGLIALVATQVAANMGRSPDLRVQPLGTVPGKIYSPEIALSESDLVKIVDILVDNACKFSGPGTPIQISSGLTPDDFLLQVRDQGRGMTAAQIANLGPYMQFDRHRHEQQGSGLGLAIAQRLVESSGGSLQIHSSLETGTMVRVVIPRVLAVPL
jgi:two-component system, sensor histidine kinase and response regulator